MNPAASLALAPGFADPESDGQALFRAVLEAMSHPGRILRPACDLTPPRPFAPLAGAVALTLCDAETPLWLDPRFAAAAGWLRFHCGAPIVEAAEQAGFAFLDGAALPEGMDAFPAGSALSPEDGVTLVIAVEALGQGQEFILSGPGIDGEALLSVSGLSPHFWRQRRQQEDLFPMGRDAILVAPDGLVGLPRTTRCREG